VLAVGDKFVLGEALDGEHAVLDALVPGEEMTQIVAIAAQGRGARSSRARLARNDAIQPGSAAIASAVCIAAEDGKSDPRRVPNGGTLTVSDARWAAARGRALVIARLAALESISASAAREDEESVNGLAGAPEAAAATHDH
jgi:hypothetical protein